MRLSPENRLLVGCIQAGISESAAERLQDLFKLPIQWEEFLAAANWHSVTPLVYANLKDIPEVSLVPREIMDQLKAAYYATLARNMLLYSELDKILESFDDDGIEAILLKGAALAKTVYADMGMRPMSDIDILVRQDDLYAAEERLSALGYQFHGGNSPEWWRENYCHIGYVKPEKSVLVELHWHITCRKDIERIHDAERGDPEALWSRACHKEPFRANVRLLSPVDALHHLCIHFLKHRFPYATNYIFTSRGALMQLSDIAHHLKYYENAFEQEMPGEDGTRNGSHDSTEFVVLLAKKIIDDGIAAGRTGNYCTEADQDVLELMTTKIFIRDKLREGADRFVIDSLSEVTLQGKARKFIGAVFPSPEVISLKYAVPLTSKKLYLYYFRRPFDLFIKHRKTISEIPNMKDDVILNRWIHSQRTDSARDR